MRQLLSDLGARGPRVLAAWSAAGIGLIALVALMILRLAAPPMAPLYANLGLDESRPVIERLEALRIPYEVEANGATILVPAERVASLQLSLAGLIAATRANQSASGVGRDLSARRAAHEDRLRRQIETLLAEIVGFDNVRASVAIELNFNRTTTSSESFDPDSQIERSTTLIEEFPPNQTGRPNPIRSEQRTEFEIAKTTRTDVVEPGEIKHISAVVLVDGTYGSDGSGDAVYRPRTADELQQWGDLVRAAIGFDEGRGDVLEMVPIRFASPAGGTLKSAAFSFLGLTRDGFQNLLQLILVLALVALVFLILAGSLSSGRLLERLTGPARGDAAGRAAERSRAAARAGPFAVAGAPIGELGEIVSRNPQEAAAILRKWLNSD